MDYKDEYLRWVNSNVVDEKMKQELRAITDEKELEDRFYKNLEFGTGGLRGVIGAGTNQMNVYTVAKATQGLAQYLLNYEQKPSVCIAYDSRNMSTEFAEIVAKVMAGNGIRVYLYESLRPTPMLSFAVRYMEASAGIMITASHNPAEYNGYKVYGPDGAQIAGQVAEETLSYIDACNIFEDVQTITIEEAIAQGKLVYIGANVDDAYYNRVSSLVIRKELVKEKASGLNIIYTPIHGSGNIPVRTILNRLGFSNVTVVPEQELPNGNFPTAPYPNPENKQVFELAIDLAKRISPDLIFGTDPDCDRIGVVVRAEDGEYKVLTGNQVGALLTEYVLSARKEMNVLSSKDTVIKTIVTSQMANDICKVYGVQSIDVLTGFKYIGEKIQEFKETGSNNFVLGFEESYGYLSGDFVRDKDAVIASVMIAEMALYYQSQGKNLYEALQDLFKKYGYYKEDLISLEMKGKDGQEMITQVISDLRDKAPKKIGDALVSQIEDYQLSVLKDIKSGESQEIYLPKSNVIKFTLDDRSWFVVRPSGTEPRMKIYVAVIGESEEESSKKIANLKDAVKKLI